MAAPSTNQINVAYKYALGREPTAAEYSQWAGQDLGQGQDTFNRLVESLRPGQPIDYAKVAAVSGSTMGMGAVPGASFTAGPTSGSYTPAPSTTPSTTTTPTSFPVSTGSQQTFTPTTSGGQIQAFPSATSTPTGGSNPYGGLPFLSPGALTVGGGSGVGGVQFPTLQFDFAKEQAVSYEQLKPFYEKLLSFAGGNLDLAKRVLQFTYQQGMRESEEQYRQESTEQALTFPVEQSQQTTGLNRRGVLSSGFAQTEQDRLKQSQNLRAEAIQRAKEDRASRLTAQKQFGGEEKMQAYDEKSFDLERERRQEASGMAKDKFGIKQTEYQASLDRALRQEQQNIRKEEQDFQKKIYAAQGINV